MANEVIHKSTKGLHTEVKQGNAQFEQVQFVRVGPTYSYSRSWWHWDAETVADASSNC